MKKIMGGRICSLVFSGGIKIETWRLRVDRHVLSMWAWGKFLLGKEEGTGGQKSEIKIVEVASQILKGPEGRGKRWRRNSKSNRTLVGFAWENDIIWCIFWKVTLAALWGMDCRRRGQRGRGTLLRRLLVGSVEKEWMCWKYILGTVITKFADGSWIWK